MSASRYDVRIRRAKYVYGKEGERGRIVKMRDARARFGLASSHSAVCARREFVSLELTRSECLLSSPLGV